MRGLFCWQILHVEGVRRVVSESDQIDFNEVELEEVEDDFFTTSDPLRNSKCEVVSRRRAFSTTCACRRRTVVEGDDYGIQCINNEMRCPAGVWNPSLKVCGTQNSGAGAGSAGNGGQSASEVEAPAATTLAPNAAVVRAPTAAAGQSANPVVEVYFYRGQEWDGQASQYMLENVDMADLSGSLQYIHREIITEHQIGSIDKVSGESRMARKYDISHILEYRFLVRNPLSQSRVQQDFHGYETYDFAQASNLGHWRGLSISDHVGAQRQSNKYVPFVNPTYWFSLSGFCPNLPYTRDAITAVCTEDQRTLLGTCSSKYDALSKGCAAPNMPSEGKHKCLCYSDQTASVVWGGLCGATEDRAPPAELQVPTGQRGCTYSYVATPTVINLDELVGITKETCSGGRLCVDYADFRANCDNRAYRKRFSPLGAEKTADVCVEYDLHPDCAQMGCDSPQCQRSSNKELGLPFWRGRCDAEANSGRAEKAAKLFGIPEADEKHIITHPPSPEYEKVPCNRGKNLECQPNSITGEQHCTRAWSGVCTGCRVPGFKKPALVLQQALCPWDVQKAYPDATSVNCKSQKASEVCCLYYGKCQAAGDSLNDDSFAEAMFSKDTATVKAFMTRVASELLEVSASDINAKDDVLSSEAYWAWGLSPVSKFMENDVITLKSLTDALNEIFPGSKVYTTTTTTTTTTTRTFRKFAALTTKAPRTTTIADMPFECFCDVEGMVKGIKTNRPGCAMHMGRRYGNFCYIEGSKSCAGAKYSKKLKLFYRPCDPELEMGAP